MPSSRERQAELQRGRYAHYRRLCAEAGIPQQSRRWHAHYRELQASDPNRRLTRRELQQWWLDRFTLAEIRQMGSALDTLIAEDEGRWEMVA